MLIIETFLDGTSTTFFYVTSALIVCALVIIAIGVGVLLLKRRGYVGRYDEANLCMICHITGIKLP